MIRCLRMFLPALDAAWRGKASSPWPPAPGRARGGLAPLLCSWAGAAVGLCRSRDAAGSPARPSCKLPRASLLTQAQHHHSTSAAASSLGPTRRSAVGNAAPMSSRIHSDSFTDVVYQYVSQPCAEHVLWQMHSLPEGLLLHCCYWWTCLRAVVFLGRISHWQGPTSSPLKPAWRLLCFAPSFWPEKRSPCLCLKKKGTLTLGVVCSQW